MAPTTLVADVGLDSRTAGAEAVYSYSAGPQTAVGQAWFVPLGPRQAMGYVLRIREVTEEQLGFPFSRLKPLGARVVGLDIPPQAIELILHTADDCLVPPSVALGLACPPGIRDRLVTSWSAIDGAVQSELNAVQTETLRVIRENPITEGKGKPLEKHVKSTLRALVARGLVERTIVLNPLSERQKLSGLLRLTQDEQKVERFLSREGKKRPAQAMTLMRLQGSESASFSIQEIKALGGVTDQTIKSLMSAGLLETVERDDSVRRTPPPPNSYQQKAIEAISEAIKAHREEGFLLYGVTGSGKTEVYLRAAAEALKQGRQVLYLVPEIALTAQVIAQLRERFGRSVAIMHSNMQPSERLESWIRVRTGEAPVLLGARSALFGPLSNIGLILMDEEHEASYKQESAPRYHTKRAAQKLAKLHNCPLVLGSATPSIESYFESQSGRLTLLELPERAASAQLPDVHIEDLSEGYKAGHPSIFSEKLMGMIRETLDKKEQIILFLNRRAFAPFLICRECGHKWTCPSCAVSLSYHKRERRLKCHHCGYSEPAADTCPNCEGTKVKPFGVGAEKVEAEIQEQFPTARVARLDRDIAKRKGALEEVLTQFRSCELDILVGTQMVAKGLDFPHVTLVGVIAADISLNIPDFRASERTFQLLSQVAGRSGRGQKPGRVVIQTMNPTHPAVLAAQDHDYVRIFEDLALERKMAGYPPFKRLVNILFFGPDQDEVERLSLQAGENLRRAVEDGDVLGPVDCAIERLNSLWRRHILIKLSPDSDVRPILAALESLESKKARWSIDVDPYSLV